MTTQNDDLESRQKAAQVHLGKAMLAYVEDRSVALIFSRDGHAEGIGTGICTKIGNRILILTAGHNLDGVMRDNQETDIIGKGSPGPIVTEILSSNYLYNEKVDVGYIEISMESLKELGKDALEMSQLSGNQPFLKDELAIIAGYPLALIRSEPLHPSDYSRITLKILSLQTVTLAPRDWVDLLQNVVKFPDEQVHILMQYPETGVVDITGEIANVPDAPGISGGGIWALHQNRPGLWSPDYTQLIGIQSAWYPNLRVAKAIQIQHLLTLVAADFEDLRPLIPS